MAFPNLKNKHKEDSLFTPKDYLKYEKKMGNFPKFKAPAAVIMIFNRRLQDYIIKNHRVKKVNFCGLDLYLLKDSKNQIAVTSRFGIGAPTTAAHMDELITFGVKKFLIIGSAGYLQKNLNYGDIVVCDKAIRDEGTSHHYLKPGKYAYASKSLVEKVEEILKKSKIKYTKGASWTIDAPYRETVAEVKRYKKEGVLTVEMEASAAFAVAKYRNVEAGAIFMISDYLGELEWKPKFHLTGKYLKKLFEVAKEILAKD
jgi:uridine phosphorylase